MSWTINEMIFIVGLDSESIRHFFFFSFFYTLRTAQEEGVEESLSGKTISNILGQRIWGIFCVRRVRTRTKVKSSYEEMVVRFENGYKHNKLRLSQWLHIEV